MVSDLDAAIPDLTDEQIVVRLFEIVAALEDGHSWIWFTQQSTIPSTIIRFCSTPSATACI